MPVYYFTHSTNQCVITWCPFFKVLGLISLALITYGYIMAELFSVTEKSCDFGKNKTTCRNAYRYEICKKMNSRLPESRVDDEALNCPSKWFVTPPLCLFGLIWLTTLVFLILLSSMDLSKYRRFLRTVRFSTKY